MQVPIQLLRAAFALLLAACLAAGCGGGLVIGAFDCDHETAAAIQHFGPPDASDDRFESGLHIRTFWYDEPGLVISFTWSAGTPCVREDHQR